MFGFDFQGNLNLRFLFLKTPTLDWKQVWQSCDVAILLTEGEKIGVEEEMELWEKIRARSLGTCDRWSSWISCPSLCDWSCCGHFVCSNSTMEVGWERNLCFPRRFGSKITSQCCPMWGDLSWWQIEMLIKDRVERGVKSANHYYTHRLPWMQNRWGCREPSKALYRALSLSMF